MILRTLRADALKELNLTDDIEQNVCCGKGSRLTNPVLNCLQPHGRKQVEGALLENGSLGLLLFQIENFFAFEKVYGEEIAEHCVGIMERLLKKMTAEMLDGANPLFLERLEAGSFAVIFSKPFMDIDAMPDLALALRLSLRNAYNRELVQLTGQRIRVNSGYAMVHREPGMNLERLFYNALWDAREVAQGRLDLTKLQLLDDFRKILGIPLLKMVYQPIVDFRSGGVLGWESLARGPEEGYFRSPQVLFDFAEEVGALFSLEKVCREEAIRQVGELSKGQKLFLNIHPRTLTDSKFSSGETVRLLRECGLSPQDVVFEITERHSITEFTLFYRTLEHYRRQGYLVAIDDAGTGYSGLSSIAEIRPEFIKVDHSLIRGIDTNPLKRAMLETLVTFVDKIGCGIIAEGVETETEMNSLISMGVHYGQGYYLAKPVFPKPFPSVDIIAQNMSKSHHHGEWKCSIPVDELIEPAHELTSNNEVKEVKRILETGEAINGVVVVEKRKPIGLVMSHHLDRQLGTHFGMALYYQRSVSHVMDPSPLVVEGNTPVEVVAKMAMKRETFKIYDHIIVTEKGLLKGIVSVQKMLDTLARVQIEMAKGANPLTGLPGNLAIEEEMLRRCRLEAPTSLVYVDLDNFKVYNDKYGFKDGDRVLLLLSKILIWAVKRHGTQEDFVGHVGGDDFLFMTHPGCSERISMAVVRCFKRLVKHYYKVEDRMRGFIQGKDRQGNTSDFPLVSVSLAIVDCYDKCDFERVQRTAAEMKQYAKSLPGNVYVRDRRGSKHRNGESAPSPGPTFEWGGRGCMADNAHPLGSKS